MPADAAPPGRQPPREGGFCPRCRAPGGAHYAECDAGSTPPGGTLVEAARQMLAVLEEFTPEYPVSIYTTGNKDWITARQAIEAGRAALRAASGEAPQEDTELLDLASELLIGADFQWGDPPTPILALGPIPKPVRVGVDLREDLRRIRDLRRASGAAAPPAGTGDAACLCFHEEHPFGQCPYNKTLAATTGQAAAAEAQRLRAVMQEVADYAVSPWIVKDTLLRALATVPAGTPENEKGAE